MLVALLAALVALVALLTPGVSEVGADNTLSDSQSKKDLPIASFDDLIP